MKVTEEQQQVTTSEKSLAVIASAGTGKTTVLTERFWYLFYEKKVPLSQLLAFTFTEKASREMKQRLLAHPEFSLSYLSFLNVMTIHSFCHDVLKKYGASFGLKKDFEILEDFAFKTFLAREIHLEIQSALDAKTPCLLDFLQKYGSRWLFQTIKDLLQEAESFSDLGKDHDFFDFLKWCEHLKEKFLQKRICSQTLCFEDLEVLTQKLFQEHPSVLGTLQETYQHILVDEFQDVSPRQYQIIQDLFNPLQNTLFIVGDPKQSIYLFRKAESRLFLDMAKRIEKSGGETLYLTETFRTPLTLQNYFNKVFQEIFSTQELFREAKTAKHHPLANIYTSTSLHQGSQQTLSQHLQDVPRLVRQLLSKGAVPSEIAILSLTRKNFPALEKALQDSHIPTLAEGRRAYFEEDLVTLLFHIFCYLAGQKDKLTLIGIFRNPKLNFSETFLAELIKSYPQIPFEKLPPKNFKNETERFLNFFATLNRWEKISGQIPVTALFKLILSELGTFLPPFTPQDFYLFDKCFRLLESWQRQGLERPKEILPLLQRWEQEDPTFEPLKQSRDGVRLSTIHGTKGLEFDYVILLPAKPRSPSSKIFFKDEGNFVFRGSDLQNIQGLDPAFEEEETFSANNENEKQARQWELARLLYVALTRSRQNLFLFPPSLSSQKLKDQLEQNPKDSSGITTYNNWLCWLSRQDGVKPLEEFLRYDGGEI